MVLATSRRETMITLVSPSEELLGLSKRKWNLAFHRPLPLPFVSQSLGSFAHFTEVTGIAMGKHTNLHFGDGHQYRPEKETKELIHCLKEQGVDLLVLFRKRLLASIEKLQKTVEELRDVDVSSLSTKEISVYLKKFQKDISHSHTFLFPFLSLDNMLTSEILRLLPGEDAAQKQQWLQVLAYPAKQNDHVHEELHFYELVKCYCGGNDEIFEEKLQKHLDTFSWFGARFGWWNQAWEKEDLMDRVKAFVGQGKNPEECVAHILGAKKEQEEATKRLLEELDIKVGTELYDLVLLAKEYAYLRTFRTDEIYKSWFKVSHFFEELRKRFDFLEDDFFYLTLQEIIALGDFGYLPIPRSVLEERKKFFAGLFFEGQVYVFTGERWKEELKNSVDEGKIVVSSSIKGTTAHPGVVKGAVKIVRENKDLVKVNPGDILIATMTFPNFISAMEKAAAFVTNEGGILCHAAIVAREMKKPCVIGTKIATSVFCDGDVVEVDADSGIVRKV